MSDRTDGIRLVIQLCAFAVPFLLGVLLFFVSGIWSCFSLGPESLLDLHNGRPSPSEAAVKQQIAIVVATAVVLIFIASPIGGLLGFQFVSRITCDSCDRGRGYLPNSLRFRTRYARRLRCTRCHGHGVFEEEYWESDQFDSWTATRDVDCESCRVTLHFCRGTCDRHRKDWMHKSGFSSS